jgi:uncharacterized Rmd1/YagE family protein
MDLSKSFEDATSYLEKTERSYLLDRSYSADEAEQDAFEDVVKRTIKTGRQRKKTVARSKGGNFRASRHKRRVYTCCVCNEFDVSALHEHLSARGPPGWSYSSYGEVLRLWNPGTDSVIMDHQGMETDGTSSNADIAWTDRRVGAKEIFVFEFGVLVFWNFSKGEELKWLSDLKPFGTKMTILSEFKFSDDDLAFVFNSESNKVSIANDVMDIPSGCPPKQRLAVSYAFAQSCVLAIFECRIDHMMQNYRYIPEDLAKTGAVELPENKLGKMIGEVFVIRHDVNLHSDILDIPDFFWEETTYEPEYALTTRYLEMNHRVEILNTRSDMLKELLSVLQQQKDNDHASNLEWIVIWLIVVECVLEVISIMTSR